MQTYIVQAGDTLYGISGQFGVTLEEIILTNNLKNNIISVGQVLKIPTLETTSLYIVKKGDSLYSIAGKYGISVDELMNINNLKNTNLSIGQQLRIPINGSNDSDNYAIYTVKVRDTLYNIALKYNVTVDSIKEINNLKSNVLSIGQKLIIPIGVDTNVDNQYAIYSVKSGDTLYSIAKRFGMSVSELMNINNLSSTSLSIGDLLKVTSGGDSSFIKLGMSCYGEGYQDVKYVTYVVKNGDNLYNIAKKYGVSVDSILRLNNLDNSNLSIGQTLKIKEV